MTNLQTAFNTVVKGLASQGFTRSTRSSSHFCMYTNPEGKHCAIGWLIPADKYQPRYDETWISLNLIRDVIPELAVYPLNFLACLQNAHDSSHNTREMKQNLRNVADTFSLSLPSSLL